MLKPKTETELRIKEDEREMQIISPHTALCPYPLYPETWWTEMRKPWDRAGCLRECWASVSAHLDLWHAES